MDDAQIAALAVAAVFGISDLEGGRAMFAFFVFGPVGALIGLNIVYPDYWARFLIWKGLITVGFVIAVVATSNGRVRSFIRTQGLPRWTS